MSASTTSYESLNITRKAPILWLAISSFRNDREIAQLLESIQRQSNHPFSQILIIDSMGTGSIPALIEKRCWCNVTYLCFGSNLGAAGNLRERLQIAADGGADFVYALNHDGHVDFDIIRRLLAHAQHINHVGAVYPLSYLTQAKAYNLTGSRRLPLPARLVKKKPSPDTLKAFWSSCNGALYATEPARRGILPDIGLWHGWEDLDYGLRLDSQGYRQVIACDAVFNDNYEYRTIDTPTGRYSVVDKPAWITYYTVRNLILIARWVHPLLPFRGTVAMRVIFECLTILFFRPGKALRFQHLIKGVIDGLQNRTGKWTLPIDTVD